MTSKEEFCIRCSMFILCRAHWFDSTKVNSTHLTQLPNEPTPDQIILPATPRRQSHCGSAVQAFWVRSRRRQDLPAVRPLAASAFSLSACLSASEPALCDCS